MAIIAGYGGYLIDASQMTSLSNTIASVEVYAAKELAASNFVNKLKSNVAASKVNGYSSSGTIAVLDNFLEMLVLTRVTTAEQQMISNAVNVLKKYLDNTSYPAASKNARNITASIATTLDTITPAMMYSAIASA